MNCDGTKLAESRGWRVVARAGVVAAIAVAAFSGMATRSYGQCVEGWIPNGLPGTNGFVEALVVWDPDGDGPVSPQLVVAGHFTQFGNTAVNNIAAYDLETGAISNLAGGITVSGTFGPTVYELAIDTNDALVVVGDFRVAGGLLVNSVARWDGLSWSSYGNGPAMGALASVAVLPDGNVVVGSDGLGIKRWNGGAWLSFDGVEGGHVWAMGVTPNGDLIAGGINRAGDVILRYIGRWDGANWYAMGSGLSDQYVYAIANVGGGEVIIGGAFRTAGGTPSNSVALWNGSAWQALDGGVTGLNGQANWVYSLLPAPDNRLIVGGRFAFAGSVRSDNVACWSGGSWSALGSGTNDTVYAAALLPNGDVAIGGDFTSAGGLVAERLALYRLSRIRADLNCDGALNNFDIDPFVLALSDAAAYALAYPGCDRQRADINCDGAVNNFDIDPFVVCLVAGGCQ